MISDPTVRLAQAIRRMNELERFALRRERFLEGLDWASVDTNAVAARQLRDQVLAADLAQGRIYVAFLASKARHD